MRYVRCYNFIIFRLKFVESFTLKRRKRKWYEKYHWTKTLNGFLIIGGRDIRSNEEIVKRRMKQNDLFFHAELRGAPYTILIRDSSSNNITDNDIDKTIEIVPAWKYLLL